MQRLKLIALGAYKKKRKNLMARRLITGSGVFTPSLSISNDELVTAFNAYADHFNQDNAAAIESGAMAAVPYSSLAHLLKKPQVLNADMYEQIWHIRPAQNAPRLAITL